MSSQVDPRTRGINASLVDTQGFVIGPAWNRAQETNSPVGTCRHTGCGGLTLAVPTHQVGRVTWYGAQCQKCFAEVAVPDTLSVLRRSSRHDEMPGGAWDHRLDLLKKLRDMGRGA